MKNLNDLVKKLVLSRRSKSVPKDPSYWTCFYYEDYTPDELHCTHKFLGKQNSQDVKTILKILDNYFKANPFNPFKIVFGKEEMFGPDKDIRVLVPNDTKDKDLFLMDLRKRLDKFKKDDYPEFRPHVTTVTLNKVDKPFKGYALLYGKDIIAKYE